MQSKQAPRLASFPLVFEPEVNNITGKGSIAQNVHINVLSGMPTLVSDEGRKEGRKKGRKEGRKEGRTLPGAPPRPV